jgi:hypothetical protein
MLPIVRETAATRFPRLAILRTVRGRRAARAY